MEFEVKEALRSLKTGGFRVNINSRTIRGIAAALVIVLASVAIGFTVTILQHSGGPIIEGYLGSHNVGGMMQLGDELVDYRAIKGTWQVPTLRSCSANEYSNVITSVGLGGAANDSPLIALGTNTLCDHGRVINGLWSVALQDEQSLQPESGRLDLKAGDLITVEIQKKVGLFTFTLWKNSNVPMSFSLKVSQDETAQTTTAEWFIQTTDMSDQTSEPRPMNLADFGTIVFSNVSFQVGEVQGAPNYPETRIFYPIQMPSLSGMRMIHVSPIKSRSFSISWLFGEWNKGTTS